ncbi:MAG TPA: 5'/3'-nucleotidase SurE, partial [Alphaproteobacteria bacterium]|nr:5'/3'-nucleotidase SurE [Alphaproteobacteria bacterium]
RVVFAREICVFMNIKLSDKPISSFRVLLVNDDGIEAEGLAVLEEFARKTFGDVFVVAPMHERSAQSRSITFRQTFSVKSCGDHRYAVDGTPTDCTLFGLHHVMKDQRPDLVLSGINHGDNAGNSITYSGTFGAAFEAGLHGVPAIAFSQLRNPDRSIEFDVARAYLGKIMDDVLSKTWDHHSVLNVNFPRKDTLSVKGISWVPAQRSSIIGDFKVVENQVGSWVAETVLSFPAPFDQEDDVTVLHRGGVTITPIMTNWTCHSSLKKMMEAV